MLGIGPGPGLAGVHARWGRGRAEASLVRVLLATTRFGITFPLATWAAFVVGSLAGGGAATWQLACGLVVGSVAAAWGPLAHRDRIISLLVVTLAAGVACVLALAWPDCSWDGALYHQPATFALADGWNPLRDGAASLPAWVRPEVADHVACYPKAAWMVGAVLYHATGDVVAGNGLHWLLLLAPFGPAVFLSRVRGRHGLVRSLLVAALVAANPVVVYQLATSYVDGIVASLLTTVVLAMIANAGRRERRWLTLAAAGAALLVGVKFTGLVYAAIVAVVFAVAACRRRTDARPTVSILGVGLLVGIALAGDSYVRNTIEHGNPFHPAWQQGQPSVLANQAAAEFLARGRIEQVVRSIASAPCDDQAELKILPAPRWPLSVWQWPARHDPRFCGFGPLYLEAALLALLLWWRRGHGIGAAAVAIFASAMATEAAWWARLAPQWWLLPILPLLGRPTRARWGVVWIERLVIAVLVINVALVTLASLRAADRMAREWQRAVASQDDAPTIERYLGRPELEYAVQRRLRERRRAK